MSIRPAAPSGPIPDWLDVDTAGWPLRSALSALTQDLLAAAVADSEPTLLEDANGNQRWERGSILPNGRTPLLVPDGVPAWWKMSETHIPALLSKLISGRLLAFGDPVTTGSNPHWIARRQWQQLRFDADNVADPVSGAGAVFWNVRVMDVDEYYGLAAALGGVRAPDGPPGPPQALPSKDIGGRPKHNTYQAFIAELIRLADTPDGLPERRDLKAYMLAWLAETYENDHPAPSTVDDWLSKLAPHKR